jgi:hypothetical protein
MKHKGKSSLRISNVDPPQKVGSVQCDTPVLNQQLTQTFKESISFVVHKHTIATRNRSLKSNDKVKFNKWVYEEMEV